MKYRLSKEERAARAQEALGRARRGQAMSNWPAIFAELMSRGIAESDIQPRENVLTFNAWRALGRHVRRGEKGVRVVTWVDAIAKSTDGEGNEEARPYRYCTGATVFHISQTDTDAADMVEAS